MSDSTGQQDVLGLDVMAVKRCRKCGAEKPLSEFAPSRPNYCRPCFAKYIRDYRASLPPERLRRDLDGAIAWQLNIKRDQIAAQRAKQGGACAICRVPLVPGRYGNGENIDHDHDTYKPRGLLCRECNKRVGWYEAMQRFDPEYKASMLAYLANPPWEFEGEANVELIRWRTRHRKRKPSKRSPFYPTATPQEDQRPGST